jgi:tight adherence protein B
MDPIAIGAIIAGAVIALGILAFGINTIRRDRQEVIDERLGRYTTEYGSQLAELTQVETSPQNTARDLARAAADDAIKDSKFAQKWKVQLAKADMKITPAEFLGLHFVSVAIFFFVGSFIVFNNFILGGVAAMVGFFVPRIYVSRRTQNRIYAFEDQLADTLQMWVNGLRGGYSVMQAIESISREAPEPTQTEFKRVVREVQLGIPMDQSLAHLLERVPSEDLDLVVTAVNIQREVGGNLAEILEIIGHTIRERIKLKGEIRVMTAQGRVTGYVIGGLPVLLLGLLSLISGEYMNRMFTNRYCGWPMLCCGAGMISLGMAAIQKIVDIEI